jgi:hypothetical protein
MNRTVFAVFVAEGAKRAAQSHGQKRGNDHKFLSSV